MDKAKFTSSVRGCWLGKNIGGTLGAPFEGKMELQNLEFYVQKDLNGNPVPNDDLDLQLVWLTLAEYYGVYNLTSRKLGEYWIDNIIGPCNEYCNCRLNCMTGFYPPLSGAVNNDAWKWSNGAWIRSEIWACLFPGDPDKAIAMAYMDASCDHSGEGIYAEMFTCALESAAFVEKDLRKLIDIALSKIPENCRISRNVQTVVAGFDADRNYADVREEILQNNADIGNFQAPANIAFMVTGLLYGRGDFGRTICIAANCGDDTDCTAATAGSVMGILLGAENIPEKWITPIGDRIVTKYIDHFWLPTFPPKTVTELTNRVVHLQQVTAISYPRPEVKDLMSQDVAKKIWAKPEFYLDFDISFARIGIEYPDSPALQPGKCTPVKIWCNAAIQSVSSYDFKWILPENWHSSNAQMHLAGACYGNFAIDSDLTPPEDFTDAIIHIPLEIRATGRNFPTVIQVPFYRKNAVMYPKGTIEDIDWQSDEARELLISYHKTMQP